MTRYARPNTLSYSFGPGPITPAVKWIIWANVAAFVATVIYHDLIYFFGVNPSDVIERYRIWQPITYMFLHVGPTHILFNMLGIWMFGVELERMWGSQFFVKFYFVAGVGAALTTLLMSFTPFAFADQLYYSLTIGASGAVYGVLLAYARYFPHRPIMLYFVFPIPAKYFVMIIGAISLLSAMSGPGGGIAHATHLGGLVAGYLYLKSGSRTHLLAEIKYRYLKWRINRMRRKFDVYSGGRADDVDRRVH